MLSALTTQVAVMVFIHKRTTHFNTCYFMTAAVAAFDELIARCRSHGSYPSVPAGTDFRPGRDGI